MQQVLFRIPGVDLPIYGYGMMLFVAFLACTWLATRLARREGIAPSIPQDLAMWIFLFGIVGARVTFIVQYWDTFRSPGQYFAIWDGGLVFYGAVFGAVLGYFVLHHVWLKKKGVSPWKMADVIAPCAALGLALGRVGCLLNGCCYGDVSCPNCPGISFPLAAAPRQDMTGRGHQTAAGFTLKDENPRQVGEVEPGTAAAARLEKGDKILKINGKEVLNESDLYRYMGLEWIRGKNDLELEVKRGENEVALAPYVAWTVPLHPTQIYESISMALLLFFLCSYFPCKRRDGSVMVFFMLGYGAHRFLNEMLRTDTKPVALGLTLSQNISLLVLAAGAALALVVWRRTAGLAGSSRGASV